MKLNYKHYHFFCNNYTFITKLRIFTFKYLPESKYHIGTYKIQIYKQITWKYIHSSGENIKKKK